MSSTKNLKPLLSPVVKTVATGPSESVPPPCSHRGDAVVVSFGVDVPERVIVVDDLPPEERDEIRRHLPGAKKLVFPAIKWERRVRR